MTDEGCTYEELGGAIWSMVRKRDGIGQDILRYMAIRNNDHSLLALIYHLGPRYKDDDLVEGAYHCLCGLGYLEPYIDREGVECARITQKGRDAL